MSGTPAADEFPAIIAFAPLIDATVLTPSTAEALFDVLNRPRDELVIYDINRYREISQFLRADHRHWLDQLERNQDRQYR